MAVAEGPEEAVGSGHAAVFDWVGFWDRVGSGAGGGYRRWTNRRAGGGRFCSWGDRSGVAKVGRCAASGLCASACGGLVGECVTRLQGGDAASEGGRQECGGDWRRFYELHDAAGAGEWD